MAGRRQSGEAWRRLSRSWPGLAFGAGLLAVLTLVLAIFDDRQVEQGSVNAVLLAEGLSPGQAGARYRWRVSIEGGPVIALDPNPMIPFEAGKSVCVRETQGARFSVVRRMVAHEGRCEE